MKNVSWPQVVLVMGLTTILMAAVTILALNGKDVSSILAAVSLFLLAVLGFFGADAKTKIDNKLDQVHDLSNGRLTELSQQNKELQAQVTALALQVQPRSTSDNDPAA